ncbi:unnamed protein product, partial [Rotaria sp. Silwood1]
NSRLVSWSSLAFSIEERYEYEPVDFIRIITCVGMSRTIFVHGYTFDKFRKERK